jgi:antitoxin (DNA-binding transcriptional repressor) of toxin-antitoxin stability system
MVSFTFMKTLTMRDFRTRPKAVRQALAEAGEAVLTVHGKPVALMLAVGHDFEETLRLVESVRAQRATRALRGAARRTGRDRMQPAEVEALIAKVRRERAQRRTP